MWHHSWLSFTPLAEGPVLAGDDTSTRRLKQAQRLPLLHYLSPDMEGAPRSLAQTDHPRLFGVKSRRKVQCDGAVRIGMNIQPGSRVWHQRSEQLAGFFHVSRSLAVVPAMLGSFQCFKLFNLEPPTLLICSGWPSKQGTTHNMHRVHQRHGAFQKISGARCKLSIYLGHWAGDRLEGDADGLANARVTTT